MEKSKCYCINLRRASNSVSQLYDDYLKPINITVNQFSLLKNLSKLEPCSISLLAKYVRLDRTTLTRTIKPLMDRHLIQDSADIGRRSRNLELTIDGKKLIENGEILWEEAQTDIENRIGSQQLKQLISMLNTLESI